MKINKHAPKPHFAKYMAAKAAVGLFSVATAVQAAGIQNDFNKDGFDDLVIGVSGDHELWPATAASGNPGTVNVIRGSATGLSATGNLLFNQNSPGIPGTSIQGSGFGAAVASGDFNRDGYADLAVGSPSDSEINGNRHGEVTIIYGTAGGLASAKSQIWHQGSLDILEDPEHGDRFGQTLAVGDFNNDRFDDLAVGVPSESLPGASSAGVVHVFYGSLTGISSTNNQLWHQDSPDIADNAQGGEFFGTALASGDFDNDGFDDLAIGVPVEYYNAPRAGLGAVHVLYGSLSRLTSNRSQFWHRSSPGILGGAQNGERFGDTLAAGDFNGDGRDDLAVGAPTHVVGSSGPCGAVNVLYGAAGGLSATGNQLWHEDSPGIAGQCDVQSRFGLALVAADFNGDQKADLAIGAPWDRVPVTATTGTGAQGDVHVLFGSANRLTTTGSQLWHQGAGGIPDAVEPGDQFGSSLGAGDYNNDGRYELVIGVPREKVGTLGDSGIVHVLKGSATGPTATGNQLWSQDSVNILGTTQTGDLFGASLGH